MTFVTDLSAQELGRQQSLQEARDRLGQGEANRNIWQDTGWFVDPIGEMKTEIDDRPMGLTGCLTPNSGPMPLNQAIEHPELFEAVPGLNDTTIEGKSTGWFSATDGEYIWDGDHIVIDNSKVDDLSVVAHEIQHAVQQEQDTLETMREASPKGWTARGDYENDYSEHEAWNVEDHLETGPGDSAPTLLEDAEEAGITRPTSPGIGGA